MDSLVAQEGIGSCATTALAKGNMEEMRVRKSQRIKRALEEIWQGPCRAPLHINLWQDQPSGFYEGMGIWRLRGRRANPIRRKGPSGKPTPMPKNYAAWAKEAWERVARQESCNCYHEHDRPWWHCPYHGEVYIDAD